MRHHSLVLFVLVIVIALSACASPAPEPIVAPQATTVAPTTVLTTATVSTKPVASAPTVTPTMITSAAKSVLEIKPVQPVGGLELVYAGTTAKFYFDQGLEAAYNSGFKTLSPRQFIDLVLNQLGQLKTAYPAIAKGIDQAINEADLFAWDSWATYYKNMRAVGMQPKQEDANEIMTVAKAFALARVYLRLKLVDWASIVAGGMKGSLNAIPLISINPALYCDPSFKTATMLYFCGMQSGSYSIPQ